MPANIPAKVATSASVTRFRGTPHELRATLPSDIASRVTYCAKIVGWDTSYRYSLHETRDLAYKRVNAGDNSVRLLVAD